MLSVLHAMIFVIFLAHFRLGREIVSAWIGALGRILSILMIENLSATNDERCAFDGNELRHQRTNASSSMWWVAAWISLSGINARNDAHIKLTKCKSVNVMPLFKENDMFSLVCRALLFLPHCSPFSCIRIWCFYEKIH